MHSMTVAFLLVCALAAAVAAPSPRDNERHGSIDVGVQRDRGVGTSVHVNGQGDVWKSRDGNSRVTAEGHYGRVVHGPARGAKDYGAGVRFEHKF